jgi:shikimate kinase
VLREENRRLLKASGAVIFLNASLDHLWQRTRNDSRRPLLQTDKPRDALRSLLEVRTPLYREVADLVVETGRQSVGKLVQQIVEDLHQGKLWPPVVAAATPATPLVTSGASA